MSLVRDPRPRVRVRRPRVRQGQGRQEPALGDHHFEASPRPSVTRNYEASRPHGYGDSLTVGGTAADPAASKYGRG